MKKHCGNLAWRLKLLLLLEEIRDSKELVPDELVKALSSLKESLVPAKDLLTYVSQVSRIYLVMERGQIMLRFQKVTALLEQALSGKVKRGRGRCASVAGGNWSTKTKRRKQPNQITGSRVFELHNAADNSRFRSEVCRNPLNSSPSES